MQYNITNTYNKKYFNNRDVIESHITSCIKLYLQNNKKKKVLDVGCGTGRLVSFLNNNGFQTQGCDLNNQALKMAKKINKKGSIKKSSATSLAYNDDSFDALIAVSLIEHLTAKEASLFLSEAARVLKSSGIIFLVTPNFSSPFRILQGKNWFGYSDPTHKTFYTPNSLSKLLKDFAFSDIRTAFNIPDNLIYNWQMPNTIGRLPPLFQSFLTYLLISTALSHLRNSFWIAAKKP